MKTLLNLPEGANTELLMDIIAKQQVQLALYESDLNYAEQKITDSIASLDEASCSISQASNEVDKIESQIKDLEYCYGKLHDLATDITKTIQKHVHDCHTYCFDKKITDNDARHNLTRMIAIIDEELNKYSQTLKDVK